MSVKPFEYGDVPRRVSLEQLDEISLKVPYDDLRLEA
jgi:hypothetical protein